MHADDGGAKKILQIKYFDIDDSYSEFALYLELVLNNLELTVKMMPKNLNYLYKERDNKYAWF